MQYAQLNEDGTYLKQCESGNIVWDENNFCTAEALYKDGRADMFRVVTLLETPAPEHDPITQSAVRDGGELVDGQWQYKWRVDNLSPEEVEKNIEERNAALVRSVQSRTQARLDDFARTRNYDGILSACTYATSTVLKFAAEGQYCVEARDDTWDTLYGILADVEAGKRPVPSGYEEIEKELPELAWPV